MANKQMVKTSSEDSTAKNNFVAPGLGRRVTIIGAGFSGLAAAHHLSREGFDVEVREASSRVGGLLGTIQTDLGPIETAANGILNSVWVEDLFDAAGVEMRTTAKIARARYFFRAGRARRWPLSFTESLYAIGFIARMIFKRSSLAPRAGETVRDWGSRLLSPSGSRYLIETALQGIYAGDPGRMSASLLLGHLFGRGRKAKIQSGDQVNGQQTGRTTAGQPAERMSAHSTTAPKRRLRYCGTVAPPSGMGELMQGLRARLEARGVRFRFDAPARAEDFAPTVTATSSGPSSPTPELEFDHPVVIATGVASARDLLRLADSERAAALGQLEVLPLVTATLHFPEGSMPLQGFGCLFPPGEARVLGVLLNNHIFEGRPHRALSETWILGGALFEGGPARCLEKTDQEILNLIREQRRQLTGMDTEPLASRITRWPKALPHLTVDIEKVVSQFRPNRGNIYLLGNFTGGIGLAKILEQAAALPGEISRSGSWNGKQR